MAIYAKNTTVPVEKSQSEIRSILLKYKAEGFSCGWDGPLDCVAWRFQGVQYVMKMKRPAGEKEQRQRWRALRLVIYAKMEAVTCGISTIEREFMAWAQGADGRTIGEVFEGRMLEWAKQGLKMLALPAPEKGTP